MVPTSIRQEFLIHWKITYTVFLNVKNILYDFWFTLLQGDMKSEQL